MKKLMYIQTKANVANVLWAWGNGVAFSHYAVKYVFKGHSLGNTVWVCKGNTISLAADKTTRFNELMEEMQNELLNEPDHVFKIRRIFDKKAKKLLKFIYYLKNQDFSKFSNEQLANTYTKIVNAYNNAYCYGEPIAFVSKNFADILEPYLIGKGGNADEFRFLIIQPEKSFIQKEHQDLLNIALKTKNKKINKNIKKKIKEHTEKYEWIPYDYGATYYTKSHFIHEFKKLKKGEIIVAVMTRPEYVPIMKKSSGIITDEGGITSHAAIVSRELNIPCIIGTQGATKKLKDNDFVELDANNGIVRIIK